MSTKRLIPACLIAATGLGLLVISGCGGSETAETYTSVPLTEEQNVQKNESVKKIFYSIPSPQEMSSLLMRAGAMFDKELMNSLDNKTSYATISSRALNLGVFGSDLSYSTIFDNTQEAMQYLSVTKALADGLGITNAFNPEVIDRIEKNLQNQDSMRNIISNSYLTTDEYLQEDGRGNVSALIIAGGWIETSYLATQTERKLAGTNKNEELKLRIAEQKYSLENLLEFLEVYKGDAVVDLIYNDLNALKEVYSQVSIDQVAGEASTDSAQQKTTIGGSATVSITDEQLQTIADRVADLRNKIVTMN